MQLRRVELKILYIKRFIRFHDMQHPSACSAKEVEQFLSHLAVQRNNSVSTQRTALNAIVFLFREFLEQPLEELSSERVASTGGALDVRLRPAY